jgi:hypothetical protein
LPCDEDLDPALRAMLKRSCTRRILAEHCSPALDATPFVLDQRLGDERAVSRK